MTLLTRYRHRVARNVLAGYWGPIATHEAHIRHYALAVCLGVRGHGLARGRRTATKKVAETNATATTVARLCAGEGSCAQRDANRADGTRGQPHARPAAGE